MTTSYFYSYIETTSYSTVFTITIRHRQSAYSLTGEWWESNDGKNWDKVTSTDGRDNQISSCWNSGVCSGRVGIDVVRLQVVLVLAHVPTLIL
jgi:hypothetical protein